VELGNWLHFKTTIMWIAKNGRLIEDKAKQAFEIVWNIYVNLKKNDTEFINYMLEYSDWELEEIIDMIPKIVELNEIL